MKKLSLALRAHLASEVTTLCTCWKATLVNGWVFGFTDHIRDIEINGVNYQAASGHTPTSIVSNSSLAVDNLEVQGVFDSESITEDDIRSGLWDFAQVEIMQVNYHDLSQGSLRQHTGRLGEVRSGRSAFVAELRGLSQQMQQTMGVLYSPTCRADLGDAACGIDLGAITVNGSVTMPIDQHTFIDVTRSEAMGYFDNGKLTWLTGANAGLAMEVKTYTAIDGKLSLYLSMPYAIEVGDTYNLIPGCRKRFTEDCQTKFSNVINFRGEPHVPGNDAMLKVGGQ